MHRYFIFFLFGFIFLMGFQSTAAELSGFEIESRTFEARKFVTRHWRWESLKGDEISCLILGNAKGKHNHRYRVTSDSLKSLLHDVALLSEPSKTPKVSQCAFYAKFITDKGNHRYCLPSDSHSVEIAGVLGTLRRIEFGELESLAGEGLR